MPSALDNGGSVIMLYELFADNGLQGQMQSIYKGLNLTVAVDTILGRKYRF
jgi:hypothetical protein